MQIYNLSQIGPDRKWLQDILLSDTETDPELSDEDEYIRDMLREHVKEKKIRSKYYQNPHVNQKPTSICWRCTLKTQFLSQNSQFGYYGASILSNVDMFHEHQRKICGITKKKKKEKLTKTGKFRKSKKKRGMKTESTLEPGEIVWDDDMSLTKDDSNDFRESKGNGIGLTKKQRKKNALSKTPRSDCSTSSKIVDFDGEERVG